MPTSSSIPIPLLLLKTKSSPIDSYYDYFSSLENGRYRPIFVPVLEHKVNTSAVDWLENQIRGGSFAAGAASAGQDGCRFGGLIFTSQRAVEAFSDVVNKIRGQDSLIDDYLSKELPLYAVGPATARGLRAIKLQCPVLGEDSGYGEALATFIQQDYNARQAAKGRDKLPLLFLVGEQRRDIIPNTLQDQSLPAEEFIEVDETTIYETGVMESFSSDFDAIAKPNIDHGILQWVVVFSPTGCKAVLQGLNMLDGATGKLKADSLLPQRTTFIATIGPTTRDYLIREFNFHPDVCAASPSPEGVGSGIEDFMKSKLELHS